MLKPPAAYTFVGQGVPANKDPVIGLRWIAGKPLAYEQLDTIYDPEHARDQWRMLDGSPVTATGHPIIAWRYRSEGEGSGARP